MAHFSNLFCAKQCKGTFLSNSLSLANPLSISMFLLMLCINPDELLPLVLSTWRFAMSNYTLTSSFPRIYIHLGAGQGSQIDFFMIGFRPFLLTYGRRTIIIVARCLLTSPPDPKLLIRFLHHSWRISPCRLLALNLETSRPTHLRYNLLTSICFFSSGSS